MAREPLIVERRDSVAVWTLARPEVRNALDAASFAALGRALAAAQSDRGLRAIVLTGEGGTFASGGDLRELRTATTAEAAGQLCDVGRAVCDGFARLPVPVIAALPGPAIGGGAELAVACDLRVADARATLCFKHVRMGVTSAWGIVPRLVALVGPGAASRLLLTAAEVGAGEALRLGLVDAVTGDGACVEQAVSWALDVAAGAPGAVASMKRLLRDTLDPTLAPELRDRERALFVEAWTGDDHREAVEAFFARRPPRWG